MKTRRGAQNRSLPLWHEVRSKRSSALVIVLACLVFLTVLIIAFFASVTTERRSAQFYANSSSVKLLADSTVSIVMGQIKDATKGADSGGSTLAWASQPGMIRNYNTSGQAAGYYKLYSSTNMVGTSSFPGEAPSSTWMNSPALYTDLNDPITNSSAGFNVYPIVDPAATNFVQGFSLKSAPVSTTDNAPMPVQWLYVLQGGQVINPDSSSTTTATFNNATVKPSVSNPVVGRIAFWTDDDTSKVNINTAAGDVWVNNSSPAAIGAPGNPGSYWDTPRIWSQWDYTNLAMCQPANGEYQRYPGHPATTYLSAVFTNILTTPASIYNLTPRVALGGSLSGSIYSGASMLASDPNNRLYASVDELLCSTNVTSGSRVVNNTALTPALLEQAKFFLTAHSRAPEVNLYNEPRVVIWPVSSTVDTLHRTAYDSLIAYCGTLNNNLYYFQRNPMATGKGSKSATDDLPTTAATTGVGRNRSLITYLRNLTSQPVPGFSTSSTQTFMGKYPHDRDQILTEIFDYIRSLNTQDQALLSANDYTSSAATAYGAGNGQIVPITDTGTDGLTGNTLPLRGFGHMPVITEASLIFAGIGETAATGSPPATSVYSGGVVAPGYTRVQAAFVLKFFDPCQGYAYSIPNFKVVVTGLNNMNWSTGGGGSSSVGFLSPQNVTVTYQNPLSSGTGEWGLSPFVLGAGYTSTSSGCIALGTIDCLSQDTTATPVARGNFTISDTTFNVKIEDINGVVLQTYNLEFPAGTFPVPQLGPLITDTSAGGATPIGTVDYRNLVARFNAGNTGQLQTFFCGNDVVRSIAFVGDPRFIATSPTFAASSTIPAPFTKVNGYDVSIIPGPPISKVYIYQAHGIIECINGNHRPLIGAQLGKFVAGTTYDFSGNSPDFTPLTPSTYTYGVQQTLTSAGTSCGVAKAAATIDPTAWTTSSGYATPVNGVTVGSTTLMGDWDNGSGAQKDGAYINKADEGAVPYNITGLQIPYFGAGYKTSTTGTITIAVGANFSPNRQMPSAGMFGSLPTGVNAGNSFQTLLFRPSPDGTTGPTATHPGAQTPPDYLLLDLFNMPIVEPYAISDPFSTAGKINMNYQIIPFSSYMTRSTGIQAVLRGEQVLAVPDKAPASGTSYKGSAEPNRRYYIDLSDTTGTLVGFKNMFATGTTDGSGSTPDIFRSASQICSIWLVPLTLSQNYSTAQAFWSNISLTGLTGDNSRERPYTNIYPRLTTKSNTFTVHIRVQTLKMVKTADPTDATWVEGTDVITGEYRGSSTVERYLDTASTSIPDYATLSQPLTAGQAIDNFYKFRVIETKQFTP